jgi:hypothetical protein
VTNRNPSQDKDKLWIPFRCPYVDPQTGEQCANRGQKFTRRNGTRNFVQAKRLTACPEDHIKKYSNNQCSYPVDGEPSAERHDVSEYPVVSV